MALTTFGMTMLLHTWGAVAGTTTLVQGFNGKSMTIAEFPAAKQAHRRDPLNNEDPRITLGLGKNVGYDVTDGNRGDWRPRPPSGVASEASANCTNSKLDKVIGYLNDGQEVTARQLRDAQWFHIANPSAPEPLELRLVGTSYSASVSVQGGHRDTRFQSRRYGGAPSSTFCLLPLARAGQSGSNRVGCGRIVPISSRGACRRAGEHSSPSANLLFGIASCLGFYLAFRRPPLPRRRRERSPNRSRGTSPAILLASSSSPTSACLEAEPDRSVFQELPTFEDVVEKWYQYSWDRRQGILSELRDHLERCGMLDIVAVDLKHAHFNLLAGHVLLEEQHVEAQESVMKGARYEDGMVPFSFKYSCGHWTPYEFVTADCEAAVEGYERVCKLPSFIEEMSRIVRKHGVEDILGFHILHRAHLGTEARGTIETPGCGDKELLVRPYSEDLYRKLNSESVQVMWSWPGSDGIFCNHCGSHCSHCGSHCICHD